MSYQNLFVAKLPRNINDADLVQIFMNHNPTSAKVMLDASTGKSKGFGFVLFHTEEEGKKAYNDLNRKNTKACRHNFNLVIYPSHHTGRAAVSASNALYVRNIPATVPQSRVEQFLASFGTLTYCAMREDHYGNPVWVVYAEYDCLDCSRHALHKLHGSTQHFRGPPIMVKYADSDEAKRDRRRRREEGKLAPAPAPRSEYVFPPPREAKGAARSTDSLRSLTSVGPNGGSETPSDASEGKTGSPPMYVTALPPPPMYPNHPQQTFQQTLQQPLQQTLQQPLQQTLQQPLQQTLQQPLQQTLQQPLQLLQPPVGKRAAAIIVLEDRQKLMLAPNAVNVRTSEVNAWGQNGDVWPNGPMHHPQPSHVGVIPPFAYMPFH